MSMAATQIRGVHGFAMTNDKRIAKNLMLQPITQYKLKTLWEKTQDPTVNHKGWAYKHQVTTTALQILRTWPSILSALHMRTLLQQPSHYEFLYDCCRFLDTGTRSMSVNHWNTVLTYEQWPDTAFVDDTPRQREQRLSNFAHRLKVSHETHGPLLAQWCKHPGGYVDLAYTLKMLFLAGAD